MTSSARRPRTLRRGLLKLAGHGEEWLIAAALAFVTLAVVAGVLSRHVLHYSLSFAEELTRYLFVWATFLGIALAARQGAHLGLGGLRTRLRGTPARVLNWALAAVAAAFFLLLCVAGALVVRLQATTGQTTAAFGLPAWWLGLAVPVGCGLAALRELAHAWRGPDAPASPEPPAPQSTPAWPEGGPS